MQPAYHGFYVKYCADLEEMLDTTKPKLGFFPSEWCNSQIYASYSLPQQMKNFLFHALNLNHGNAMQQFLCASVSCNLEAEQNAERTLSLSAKKQLMDKYVSVSLKEMDEWK